MTTDRIDWDAQPLGLVPDRELADRLDRGWQTVSEARRRRGIHAVRSVERQAMGAEDLLDEAVRALRCGEWARAVQLYRRACRDLCAFKEGEGVTP